MTTSLLKICHYQSPKLYQFLSASEGCEDQQKLMFEEENALCSSYRYVIGLVTFQRYRYTLYNTRSCPLTTRRYPRIFSMTMPLQ